MINILKTQYNRGYVFLDIPYHDKNYYKNLYKGTSFTFDPISRHWVCDIEDIIKGTINILFAIVYLDVAAQDVYNVRNFGAKYDKIQELYYTTIESYELFDSYLIPIMAIDGQKLKDRIKMEHKKYFENNP